MSSEGNSGGRCLWVDCCKGMCIVLVVYGHVVGGLAASGDVAPGSRFISGRDWVYLFHMPTFFFLSGLFAQKALNLPFWGMVRSRLVPLIYPYILWTGIFLGTQLAMARYSNNPADISRALRFYYEPYGYGLWFLYALFIVSLLLQAFLRARIPPTVIILIAAGLYVLSLKDVFSFWPILDTSLEYLVFYALGGLFPDLFSSLLANAKSQVSIAIGGSLLALITFIYIKGWNSRHLLGFVVALCGLGGVVCISKGVVKSGLHYLWSIMGLHSLEIYLGHALFGTASRVVLKCCGIHAPWIFVVCGVVGGVFASLGLALLCHKSKFPYLFRWPLKRGEVLLARAA